MSNIVKKFYDELSGYYDLIFADWNKSISYHASTIDSLFKDKLFVKPQNILDCACGIGTQTLGLAGLGYNIVASDISSNEIQRAKEEAAKRNLQIEFQIADFQFLEKTFSNSFDAIIAFDNALPHLLSRDDLSIALASIYNRLDPKGVFLASIRDYDDILIKRPQNPEPYIINTPNGRRIVFQVWDWNNDIYDFTQYIIEDEKSKLDIHKANCKYRALQRSELFLALKDVGFEKVQCFMPDEIDFYQPVVVGIK